MQQRKPLFFLVWAFLFIHAANVSLANESSKPIFNAYEPQIDIGNNQVVFYWDQWKDFNPETQKYELKVFRKKRGSREEIYSTRTTHSAHGVPQSTFDNVSEQDLVYEVHLIDSDVKKDNAPIAVVDGFSLIPSCSDPEGVEIDVGEDAFRLHWKSPTTGYTGIRYFVRYRKLSPGNARQAWREELVYQRSAFTASNLLSGATYEVEIKKLCDGKGRRCNYESDWLHVGAVTLKGDVSVGRDSTGGDPNWCDSLTVTGISEAGGNYLDIGWTGFIPSPDGPRIEIRYRPLGSPPDAWQTYVVVNGQLSYYLDQLSNNTAYVIQIRVVWGGSNQYYTNTCDWIEIVGTTGVGNGGNSGNNDPPPPSMPALACDQAPTPVTPNGTCLERAEVGNVFYMNNFPILVETLSQNGPCTFSGTGVMALPIDGKFISVDFNGITVEENFAVSDGQIVAMASGPVNLPDCPPLTIGSEICQVKDNSEWNPDGTNKVTGLPTNAYGFDQDGNFKEPPYPGWEPGDLFDPKYDPNGFDANGIHVNTGTIYNENGCSRDSVDVNGDPCDPGGPGPYYWMVDEGGPTPTEVGTAFANTVEDTLGTLIVKALNQMLDQAALDEADKKQECDALRGQVTSLTGDLNLQDQANILGEEGEFVNDGMHQHFKEAPQKIVQHVERDTTAVQLENTHVDLYECDVALYDIRDFIAFLNDQKQPDAVDSLKEELLTLIRAFDSTTVNIYSNPDSLCAWVVQMVDELSRQLFDQLNETASLGSGHATPAIWEGIEYPLNEGNDPYNYLASASDAASLLSMMDAVGTYDQESMNFQFNQGWTEIHGINRAFYLRDLVRKNNRSVKSSPNGTYYPMPIEINNEKGGRTYTVLVDNIRITPTSATLDAYLILNIPTSEQCLVFQGLNISFDASGIQSATLCLGTDVEIRLLNSVLLRVEKDSTCVSFDCNGFENLTIHGEIEVCRGFLTPVHESTFEPLPEPARVKAHVATTIESWDDFTIDVSIDPFQVTNINDITWKVQNAVFDYSDESTPESVKFPVNYTSPFVSNGEAGPLWKGFYLADLTVNLPKQFSEDTTSITVSAQDVIIDDTGFTGRVSVNNVLDLEDGDLGGWAFSIDQLTIGIVQNNLSGGSMDGLVHISVFTSTQSGDDDPITAEDCFDYHAAIYPNDVYEFVVTPPGEYRIPMFLGDVTITNSEISVTKEGSEFLTVATLSGDVSIGGDLGSNIDLDIPDISFKDMQVSNQAPYFSPGTWEMPASVGANFGGFSLTIDSIRMVKPPGGTVQEAALSFKAGIKLVEEFEISASAGILIIGTFHEVAGRQKWKYDRFEITNACVSTSFPGVDYLAGCVSFFEDNATYGKGFHGYLGAQFMGLPRIDVVAQFGKLDGTNEPFKYFFVDAMATFDEPGIKIAPPLNLRAFGGGVSYKMNRNVNVVTLGVAVANPGIGQSFSGTVYTPDENIHIGLNATVGLALDNEKMFNANATFGMQFNAVNGSSSMAGLDRAYFKGNAKFMSEYVESDAPVHADSGKPNNGAVVSAYIDIEITPENLHGLFEVYINVPNAVHGAGPDGLFTQSEFNFGSQGWYIKMGKPRSGNGIVFDIPLVKKILKASAYLQVGSGIDLPPTTLPECMKGLRSCTGISDFEFSDPDASGNGFMFGAEIELDVDLQFLFIYAYVHACVGFDVMLYDLGDAHCAGSGDKIGINGWYAYGQAWAYLSGGVDVKAFGKRFKVLEVGAGVALSAGLPNPFSAKGCLEVSYNVLGLIKGSVDFQFEIGKKCEIVGDYHPALELTIVDRIIPADGAQEVTIYQNPKVLFEVPIGQAMHAYDVNGNRVELQAEVARVTVTGKTNLLFNEKWHSSDYLELEMYEFLPGSDTVSVEVIADILVDGAVYTQDTAAVTFFTAPAPNYIPAANLSAAYPVEGQFNFYPQEYVANKGFMLLKKGQGYLFNGDSQNEVRITTSSGSSFVTPLDYDHLSRMISFDLPPDQVPNGAICKLDVLAGTVEPPDPGASFSRGKSSENVAYTYHFRVSEHNTFIEKMEAWEQNQVVVSFSHPTNVSRDLVTPNLNDLVIVRESPETESFDRIELRHLIQFRKDVSDPYQTSLPALPYRSPPIVGNGIELDYKRDSLNGTFPLAFMKGEIDIPPNNAILSENEYGDQMTLNDYMSMEIGASDFSSGSAPDAFGMLKLKLTYFSPAVMFWDLIVIKQQAGDLVLRYVEGENLGLSNAEFDWLDQLDLAPRPGDSLPRGNYVIYAQYTIPGLDIVTTPGHPIKLVH